MIGGGNIFRGVGNDAGGVIDRAQGDYMGMLATVINSMALQSALEGLGVKTRLQSAIKMEQICEPLYPTSRHPPPGKRTCRHLRRRHRQPLLYDRHGRPLRAVEINADVILKGTRVDGIYTADPEKDKNAVKYETVTFDEVYEKGLKIMDLTAFTLCNENKVPIIVFDMNKPGNLLRVMEGQQVGTLVEF